MPIKLPENLPAFDVLTNEGVMVMSESRAGRQDIRPLKIGLLNLMPKKIQTENQFARLIGATPLQIELSLIRMSEHQTKNTAAEHMEEFYRPFEEVRASGDRFDGLIITGAPIEHLNFEDVTYWQELQEVFDWAKTHVYSTFGVCWGGMALAYHRYGIQKHDLSAKAFGCYPHAVETSRNPLLRGFPDVVYVPVSRWTEVKEAEIRAKDEIEVLISSPETGPCLIQDVDHRTIMVFNHFEYDNDTLKQEYDRDVANGTPINVPVNYYPENDPARTPLNLWRGHAHLLYGNWINEIYQGTPFNLADL